MSSSVKWSQLNDDSSSVSSASSGLQQVIGLSPSNPITNMKKIQSSPPTYMKNTSSTYNPTDNKVEDVSKNGKNNNTTHNRHQQRTIQNINKLNDHRQAYVWLYIGDGYYADSKDDVLNILEHCDQFQKILSMNKGWNVYLLKQKAKKYLENGITKEGFILRFIYSTKNQQEPDRMNNYNNNGKYNNNYRPDQNEKYDRQQKNGYKAQNRNYVSPNSKFQEAKSSKLKGKKTYTEKNTLRKDSQIQQSQYHEQQKQTKNYKARIDYNDKPKESQQVPKKKVKYVARSENPSNNDTLPKKQQMPLNTLQIKERPSQQSNSSPDKDKVDKKLNDVKSGMRNRYINKQQKEREEQAIVMNIESMKQRVRVKQELCENLNGDSKKKQDKQQQLVGVKRQSVSVESDSSEEIRRKKKELVKKKNKKKKNVGNNNGGYQDPSNPFSCLAD